MEAVDGRLTFHSRFMQQKPRKAPWDCSPLTGFTWSTPTMVRWSTRAEAPQVVSAIWPATRRWLGAAGRRGEIHLFSQQGRGIRRVDSGPVRRLVGWLDREHLLWQDPDGHLWCGRLTGDDRKRKLEDRSWSWCSTLAEGRLLLQSSDGGLWEGVPHPFGWDMLNRLEYDSLEPMGAVRSGDGWWVLGIEGHLISMTEGPTKKRTRFH